MPDEQLARIRLAIEQAFGGWYPGLLDDLSTLVNGGAIAAPPLMDTRAVREATRSELDAWHALRKELLGLDDVEIITRLLRPVFAALGVGVDVDANAAEQIAARLLADLTEHWPPDETEGRLVRVIAAVEVITRAAPTVIDAAISLS